jgi:hypothetical protein
MRRSIWQYLAECGLAYPVGILATFPIAIAVGSCLNRLFPRWADDLGLFFASPGLAWFWLTAACVAWLVHLRARSNSHSILACSRAGEWVWVAGVVYIIWGFFSYLPIGHGWARDAICELFASHDDIGNLATAPFYMGIAYSLTRHILRVRREKREARLRTGAPAATARTD